MALTVAVAQVNLAQFGTPTTFTATVSNASGSTISLYALNPSLRLQSGGVAPNANISAVTASPQLSTATVGPNQFNVQIADGGSSVFSFQATIFGSAVAGVPAMPSQAFIMQVDGVGSDGNSFSGQSQLVQLNQPQFGQPPGSPPNSFVGAPAQAGTMTFQVPANAVLAL